MDKRTLFKKYLQDSIQHDKKSNFLYTATIQEVTGWPHIRCPDCKRQSRLGREDRAVIHSHGPVTCVTKTDLMPSLRPLNDSVDCCFVLPFFFPLFCLSWLADGALSTTLTFMLRCSPLQIMSWATTQTRIRRYKPPAIPNFPFWPQPRSGISAEKIVL